MTERKDRRNIEATVAPEGSPEWYLSSFKQNWKKLRAKKIPRFVWGLEHVGLAKDAIDMKKYTPAVLQELVDVDGQSLRFDVLTSPNPYPKEGPFHTDIEKIYRYKDHSAVRNMHRGEVFEASDGKKYLLAMMSTWALENGKRVDYGEEAHGQHYQEQLARDLIRYGITALLVCPHADYRDYSVKSILVAPDYLTKLLEGHVLDRFARGVAIQRGWTNTQLMRFRLTGEMPQSN